MPSSPSTLLQVELQASGENSNSWGTKANATFSRLEDAIAGRTPIVLSANYTLTDTQYTANESRAMVLDVSGAGGFNIVIPNRAKGYVVRNGSSGIATITTGSGTTVAVAAGATEWVFSTGANVVHRMAIPAAAVTGVVNTVAGGSTGLSFSGTSALTLAGTLAVANGGSGLATTPTNGQLLIGNGTNYTLASLTAGANITITPGAGSITIAASGSTGVATVSGGTTGLTFSGTSAVTMAGTLAVANGGTGVTSSTGTGSVVLSASPALTGAPTSLGFEIGFRDVPQNAQTAAYQLVLTDRGKHISITTGGITVPANGTVAFGIGTAVTIVNNSASSQTIAITTDVMTLAGTATVGTRTLAQNGIATLLKIGATNWLISGAGVS